ncbi:hypothetical protein J437_LFUL009587, partial [Ladona fulva]
MGNDVRSLDAISEVYDEGLNDQIYSSNPIQKIFSPLDYSIFAAMLLFSGLIGVYFAFFAKKKQNNTAEYLMGSKSIGIIPVAISLIGSCISGITLIGASAEMYTYGTQYATSIFGLLLASLGCGIFFLPVYSKLQLTTSFEYLRLRFGRGVHLFGSFLFLINSLLYIPIVIFIPALAFNQVSGFNLHVITPIVCIVCIFYTSMGGLKAVVWTDALQTLLMFSGIISVVWIGTDAVGGFSEVWKRNEEGHRIEFFKMDLDPTVRNTFWNTVFGSAANWMTHLAVNQAMVQHLLALPTLGGAQIMLSIFTIGVMALYAVSLYAGLVIYANYHDCDIVSTKMVQAPDQMLPYFVLDLGTKIPGLPGLFMAAVFGAALSSMSTGIASMAAVIYEDFMEPFLKEKLPEEKAAFLIKVIAAVFGFVCVGIVFIIENLGTVIEVSWSLGGVTQGTMIGIVILGMFFPWTNSKGTLIGGIFGLVFMGVICFGSQAYIASGRIKYEEKPITTAGCPSSMMNLTIASPINTTTHMITPLIESTPTSFTFPLEDQPLVIFRLSYTIYALIGLLITLVVGLIASALTGPTNPADVHIDLLTPVVQPLYVGRCKGGDPP